MTKLFWRTLFILIPFLYSVYLSAQPKERDCSTTCFSTEVVSSEKLSATCTSYELKVTYSGACAHALSHFSLEVPCGTLSDLWNSEGWPIARGTDPTTGLTGFKVDNISGFGEGAVKSFNVKFTRCTTDECAAAADCWQPQVAYKAGTCVNYQNVLLQCGSSLKASLEKHDVTCAGAQDGSLSLHIEEGEGPYTILWSTQSSAASLTGLPAGSYSVTIRDARGTELVLEETISQPEPLVVTAVPTAAACSGIADGAVDITVSGGSAPYSFSWSNGATSEDISALNPGSYMVSITDANGCATVKTISVGNRSTLSASGTHVKPDCNTSNGSINLTVTGGVDPYSYAWSNGASSQDLESIAAGLYSVTVTDGAGCSTQAAFFLKENNTLTVSGSTTPTSCSDDASGTIDITVTGGNSPYSYSWSNGATSEDLSGLNAGYYTVGITDVNGCTTRGAFVVSKNTFQVSRIVTQPTCHGENNGSITLQEPIGGTAPFTYEWSHQGYTGNTLTDLAPGVYTVTITDASGCSRVLTSTITEPQEIVATAQVINADCSTNGGYAIDLNVTGGTAPYTFVWSNGSMTEDQSGLTSGSYTVAITDANGCSVSTEVVIEGGSTTWECLIGEPSQAPVCGSENNTLTSPVTGADSYAWTVESTDGSWSIDTNNAGQITYSAGSENSSATFTLTINQDGCTKTCSLSLTSCRPSDDTNPGTEIPGGPGDDGSTDDGNDDDNEPGHNGPDNPAGDGDPQDGEDETGGGDQDCETCFETTTNIVGVSEGCRTYEMVVTTSGLCRHDLSHWTLAIPCGTVSDYSNSEGWKMETGQDPTTGVFGLKVDGINQFGKEVSSFTVRFTLCGPESCSLSSWIPSVAYKAGQCIAHESAEVATEAETTSAYPNPFGDVINFKWSASTEAVDLQIIDQYGNIVAGATSASISSNGRLITLDAAQLPRGIYYYRLTTDGKTYQGKLSKQ